MIRNAILARPMKSLQVQVSCEIEHHANAERLLLTDETRESTQDWSTVVEAKEHEGRNKERAGRVTERRMLQDWESSGFFSEPWRFIRICEKNWGSVFGDGNCSSGNWAG